MAEKVKVSREVAECIKRFQNNGDMNWEDAVLYEHIKISEAQHKQYAVEVNPEALCILKYSTFELARILVLGYEIEETPEEKLLATYERQCAWQETDDPYDRRAHKAYGNAIVYTLDTLGIKIKGIND